MRKIWAILMVLAVIGVAGPALAKDFTNEPEVGVPVADGVDAIVPDRFIQTVPGATEGNVWARLHDEPDVKWVKAKKEGKNWRVPNGANKAMHPYIGNPADYKPTTNFAKIENIWALNAPFVKFRGENPYLFVK